YSIDNGITTQAGNSFTNLNAGIYNIVVTDINGCDATSQVNIMEPQLLTATAASVTASCENNNGTINVNAQGGTAPLQYSSDNGTTYQPGAVFNNMAQGLYNIVITDANGCTFNLNSNVANAAGPAVGLIIADDITCFGAGNGEITIIANGGAAPLQYSIDNGTTYSPNIL